MYCRKVLCVMALSALLGRCQPALFDGVSALRYTCRAVSFGPRPPESTALVRLRAYIWKELEKFGWQVIPDPFRAMTPRGPVNMQNIIARRPGVSGRTVVLSGHYDTKWLPSIRFVGANDGGSSTGFLLEMARVLPSAGFRQELLLVFFDGEEAFGPWSDTDGLYGSRHLAARWAADGTLNRLQALINVDMIADRDLGILREMNSTRWLRELVWQTATELGFERHFLSRTAWIEDDHVPFLRRGASAVNLIDFEYGPGNSYWHTEQDSCDKLSAASLEVIGRVVLAVLGKLDSKRAGQVPGSSLPAGSSGSNCGPPGPQSSAENIRPCPPAPLSSFTVKRACSPFTDTQTWW